MPVLKTRNIIIMFIIMFFYSNLPIYMEIEKINIFHMKLPYYVALFFLTVVIFFFFTKTKLTFLKNPLNIWILVYLTLILIWFLLPTNQLTEKELFIRIYNLFFMFMITIFIYFDRDDFINVKKAIFLVTIFSIIMNIYQFTNPEVFFSGNNPFGVIGRSAGLYLNPTISGMAILLGMVMTVTFVPIKYRMFYMMFSLIGILLTFSRGPLIGWGIAFIYIIFTKTVSVKNKTFIVLLLFLGVLIGLPFLIDFIQNNYNYGGDNLINRLMWFSDVQAHVAYSQLERLKVMERSWDLFASNPLIGAGLGVTLHWNEEVSTHNMYLFLAAEFGIIGILIYPLSILAATWRGLNGDKVTIVLFILVSLVIGLFRHNQYDQFFSIISFAYIANLSFSNWKKKRKGIV